MDVRTVGCVPVVYVTDVQMSAVFYALLGFEALIGGRDGEWRWSYLRSGEVGILLASGGSVWTSDPGPMLLYLRIDDCDATERVLRDAGTLVEHLGYPDHAPGGELKVLDPDGHGLLLGQVTMAAVAPEHTADAGGQRMNVLVRAAEAARRRGHSHHRCQADAFGRGLRLPG